MRPTCLILRFSLLLLVCATPGGAQTRVFVGGGGGFGAGYPGHNQACDSGGREGAHLFAMAGIQRQRVALFADANLVVSGGGTECAFITLPEPNPPVVPSEAIVHYPMYPLTANVRVDAFGNSRWKLVCHGDAGCAAAGAKVVNARPEDGSWNTA